MMRPPLHEGRHARHTRPVPARLVPLALAVACIACARGAPAGPLFEDRSAQLGLDFVHDPFLSGEHHFFEIAGFGGGLLDYDGDGDLDAWMLQGGAAGRDVPPSQPQDGRPKSDRLYQNQLKETGHLGFVDVTALAGLDGERAFGMGLAAADMDNDGDVDVYVCNFDGNVLWLNEGGRFRDVTQQAGVAETRWSSGATWLDVDRDGLLDLYVATYVNYNLASHKVCYDTSGAVDYCGPSSFQGYPDRLFRNLGGGRFEDVTGPMGIGEAALPGLGVVAADLDGDGWQDVYVANDGTANELWMNRQGRRMENVATEAGAAYDGSGAAEASMGVVVEDLDGDQDLDIYLTHLSGETNTFYANQGGALFLDQTDAAGLGAPSLPLTGFGVEAADFDGDGLTDLAIANGGVRMVDQAEPAEPGAPGSADPLAAFFQRLQIMRGQGEGRYQELDAATAGEPFAERAVFRAVIQGDLDDDGDTDLTVTRINGRAQVLVNRAGPPPRWVGLRLLTADGRRDALGAVLRLRDTAGRTWARRVHVDGSYLSSADPRVLLTLGEAEPAELEVAWPSGRRERFPWADRPIRAYHSLQEGGGEPLP